MYQIWCVVCNVFNFSQVLKFFARSKRIDQILTDFKSQVQIFSLVTESIGPISIRFIVTQHFFGDPFCEQYIYRRCNINLRLFSLKLHKHCVRILRPLHENFMYKHFDNTR